MKNILIKTWLSHPVEGLLSMGLPRLVLISKEFPCNFHLTQLYNISLGNFSNLFHIFFFFFILYPLNYNIPFSKHRPSEPMLSISRNFRLCVCLSVCLFTFEVPFKFLFAPTFLSCMSKIVKDADSLGKINGKKWSRSWTFLFGNDLKLTKKWLILPYKTSWKPWFPVD